MENMKDLINRMLWNYYNRYKTIADVDVDGGYTFIQKLLLFLRVTKVNLFGDYLTRKRLMVHVVMSPDLISDIIYDCLSNNDACMVARFGANEQRIVANYLSIINPKKKLIHSIMGREPFWWWDKSVRNQFCNNAGFFPNESDYIEKYSRRMIDDIKDLDVLLTWFGWEPLLLKNALRVELIGLQEAEPWWQQRPWTRYLENKKVLVVHPFAEMIEQQYKNRDKLFKNNDILPLFELKTLKAVQSIGGRDEGFNNWFEALKWMENEMDKVDYDVALIGCGAYGFCLAAHAKRKGKKAVHLGGVLQLLFGIKGKRWEDKNYHPVFDYTTLFNDYWIRPDDNSRPDNAKQIEDACYW